MQQNNITSEGYSEIVVDKNLDRIVSLATLISKCQAAFIYSQNEKVIALNAQKNCTINLNKNSVDFFNTLCDERKIVESGTKLANDLFKNGESFFKQHNIEYFASWPLISTSEKFSGILCICNNMPSELDDNQKKSIELLSDQIIAVLEEKNKSSKPGIKRLLEKKFASLSYYYNAFLNGTDYGVILINLKGVVKVFNTGAEKMLGYSSSETIDKKTIFSFHNIEELHKKISVDGKSTEINFDDYVSKPRLGMAGIEDWTFIKKDGKKIIVQLSLSAIKNEQKEIISYLAIAEDVTERRKIQEALQISEERHRLFFENSQGLMCSHDVDGNLLSINSAGASLLGYTPNELIGKNIRHLIPTVLQTRINEYRETINTNGFATGLVKLIHRDGSVRVLFYKNNRIGSQNNAYVIGNAIDVSARIELENDLKRVKVFAERTSLAKDQFLANMSHEIRTPMNAIIGFTDILVNTELNGNQRECIDAIKSAGENLLGIINDILDFSKIQSGKLSIEKLPFNIKETALNTSNILKVKANEKGIKLNLVLEKELPDVLIGDSLRINQILLNIIGNAIKFTERGEVTVSINVLKNNTHDCLIYFSVKDTGIGIDAEHLESIFERFTQASNETTRRFGGTGLGLSISRNLIQMQGGVLKVSSKPGAGSEFTFELLFEKQQTVNEPKHTADNGLNQPLRVVKVLLMEDNDLNQKLARKVVTGFGFSIDIAGNGQKGVEMLANGNYDVILMDLQMPVMDGYQATKHIREVLKSNIPIIAMTAHSLIGEKEKCLEMGMNEYLSKPFKAPDLLYKINQLTPSVEGLAVDEALIAKRVISYEEESPNLQRIQELSGGDTAFESELIQLFLQNAPKDINSINAAISEQNWSEMKQHCHKLKSSVMVFGLDQLGKMLSDMEHDEFQGEPLKQIWLQVQNAFKKAVKEMNTLIVENYR
ncbi:MAG: PAS domain S-box protein [Bacteroidia bacterium]|nr:PAS domain S-box protein [Bacteroidia bacterium]